MNWGILDFVAAAIIIGGTAFGIWLSFHLFQRSWLRWLLALGVLLVAILVWVELAVGILD